MIISEFTKSKASIGVEPDRDRVVVAYNFVNMQSKTDKTIKGYEVWKIAVCADYDQDNRKFTTDKLYFVLLNQETRNKKLPFEYHYIGTHTSYNLDKVLEIFSRALTKYDMTISDYNVSILDNWLPGSGIRHFFVRDAIKHGIQEYIV